MNLRKWVGPFTVMVLTAVLVKTTYPYIRHKPISTAYAIVIGISAAFGYAWTMRIHERKQAKK